MKRFISFLLVLTLITSVPVSAARRDGGKKKNKNYNVSTEVENEAFDDSGMYTETVITTESSTDESTASEVSEASAIATYSTGAYMDFTRYITKTKTTYYKNSEDKILWFVAVTATFSYDGSTSKCTSCYHRAGAPGTTWAILRASSSKKKNTATATATARHSFNSWIYNDYTRSVTIKCTASGTVS